MAVLGKRRAEIAENKFLDIKRDLPSVGFREFAEIYVQWAKANHKPWTFNREPSLVGVLDREFGSFALDAITPLMIESWKTRRLQSVAPATINRGLALLKHMYRMAIEWAKVQENPAQRVRMLKGEVKRVRYLMPEEVERLLSHCKAHLRPIVTVAIHTGMRKSKLLGLRWDQVNLDQGFVSLLDTKNHERRDIPLNETAKASLENLRPAAHSAFVFSDGNGSHLKDLKHSFATALKEAGIEDFRFHDMRHTFASNLVMAGVDILTVKELMAHKDLAMTLRYSHLAPNHKTKAVKMLDETLTCQKPVTKTGHPRRFPANQTASP